VVVLVVVPLTVLLTWVVPVERVDLVLAAAAAVLVERPVVAVPVVMVVQV
jgi:hypothetical protein